MALYGGPERDVHVRLAEHADAIYLDLGDPSWRVVEITPAGWEVRADPPVRFRRPGGMGALPHPVRGGSTKELRPFLNPADQRDWILTVAWLVSALRPRGPYPALNLAGEQGTGKSTEARVLRELVDPNAAELRSEPREVRDLMIAATNAWVLALDNLSKITPWLSDALCRLATGGGFATRELYADDEEIIFDAQRPIIFTGIEELATRGDLLDRLIVRQLPVIAEDERTTEDDFWSAFEIARPRILGALLDAVACALRELSNVRLDNLPRMADFAKWATAAGPALGWDSDAFLNAYGANRAAANDLALEGSLVAEPVRAIAFDGGFEGTASQLLERLANLVGEDVPRRREWPKTPSALSAALTRIAPNLRLTGIQIKRKREERRRLIHIWNEDANRRQERQERQSGTDSMTAHNGGHDGE